MLSVERPSGRPSCSSSQASSPLKSNSNGAAAAPETQAPDPADHVLCEPPPPSRFSIRGYVLSSRSKDIKKNWPFHLKYLRCLLKHDIHDLLPPFEPPDLVRISSSISNSCGTIRSCSGRKDSSLESDLGQKEADSLLDTQYNGHENANSIHSNLLMPKPLVQLERLSSDTSLLNGYQACMPRSFNDLSCKKTVSESTVTCNANGEEHSPTSKPSSSLPSLGKTRISKDSVKAEIARAPVHEKQVSSKEPAAKKCKLIVKTSAILDIKRGDEVSINSSIVSDSMASKVCPVCKTFSSTSNTTLNAHIDQCLSMEPEANCVTDTTIIHKVKPTKKRLMVDIYNTAPRCTLEDLDRRNGTNWATDPTFTVLARGVPTDNRMDRCSSGDQISNTTEKSFIQDHVTEAQDGAVFFDANGTKVCILSRLNTTTPATEAQITKSRKLKKEAKKQMGSACSKRARLIPHHVQSLKLKSEGKKFCSLKLLKDEVPVSSTSNDCLMDVDKDDLRQLQKNSPMNMKPNGPRLVTQQAVAKLHRRVAKDVKNHSSSVQHPILPSSQSDPSVSGKSKSLVFKIAQHTDNCNASSKDKSVKILSDSLPRQDIGERKLQPLAESGFHCSMGGSPSRPGLRPRLSSRPSVNHGHPRSQQKRALSQKFGKLARCQNWRQSEGRKLSRKSLPPVEKCKDKNLRLVSKMLRKHRSLKKSQQKEKKQTSIGENALHEHHGKDMVIAGSEDLDNFLGGQTNSLIDRLSSGQSNVAQSQIETGGASMNGRKDDSSRSYFEGASSESQVINLGYQSRCFIDAGAATKSYMDHIGSSVEPTQCGGPMAASSSSLESWSRLVENVNFIGGKESLGEPLAPRLFNHPMGHCGTDTSNVDVIASMEIASQQEFKSLGSSCPGVEYMECRMNTAQDPGLSDYATSSTNDVTEVPQGNSSVTSNKITYNDGHNVVVDSAPSDTPESGASVVSDLVDEPNREDSTRPAVLEGHSVSGFSNVLASSCLMNTGAAMGEDAERYKVADTSTVPKPWYWGDRDMCSDREKFAPGAPRQYILLTEQQLASESGSDLQMRNNFPSCSYELAVTIDSSNSVARGQHEEENARPTPCSDSKLPSLNPQLEPQFPPNPVFRLMGKDLLLPQKEVQHVHDGGKTDCSQKSARNIDSFHSHYTPPNYVMNPITYESLQHQVPEKWRDTVELPFHPSPNGQQAETFHAYRFPNVRKAAECSQAYQSWPCPGNMHSLAYHGERSALPCEYQMRGGVGPSPNHSGPVIIIDDPQDSKVEVSAQLNPASRLCSGVPVSSSQQVKKPLSCIPAHYAIDMGEMPPLQLSPGLYCSYTRSPVQPGTGWNSTGTGWNSSAGSGLPSSAFVVPSIPSSKLTRSVYYFPSMR